VAIQTPTNPSVSDQDLHQVLLFLSYLLIIADINLLVGKHKQSHRSLVFGLGFIGPLSFQAAGRVVFP